MHPLICQLVLVIKTPYFSFGKVFYFSQMKKWGESFGIRLRQVEL
jgi:hypothetical protein